jgi:Fur family ferric uptake transcriptional regulator
MERRTRQRDAVEQAIAGTAAPLTAEEVLATARRASPGLGLATVYRTLKRLVEAGQVVTVELPGEPARYESAHLAHHHHFHCRSCSRVFEVLDCPRQLERITPQGFVLERHEVVLYGLCRSCLKAG